MALPLVPLIMLMFWNPVLRVRTVGARQVQTLDPASIFTAPYFLMVASGFLVWGVCAFLAYLDWDKLRRDGVVRPFHWAWVFLSREVYVVGRSVIVHEVAPRRGLARVGHDRSDHPRGGARRPQDVRPGVSLANQAANISAGLVQRRGIGRKAGIRCQAVLRRQDIHGSDNGFGLRGG